MESSTLASNGRITLPKFVRDRLRLGVGDRVEFIETQSGIELRSTRGDIRQIKGILATQRKPVSIESMNKAIARMGRPKA